MAVRWPKKIKPDATPRSQFHHVNDLVPTIYEVIGITPPHVVNGVQQDPFDGVSAWSTRSMMPKAKGKKLTQYFEIMGSRAHLPRRLDRHRAFGPRIPWVPGAAAFTAGWTPDKDKWELYNLDRRLVAGRRPRRRRCRRKLEQMKEMFAHRSGAQQRAIPLAAACMSCFHPELPNSQRRTTSGTFAGDITRMPEFLAPALGTKPNVVTVDAEIPANANGVLYALGAFSGGLTSYVKDGILCYEYNLFEIQRTKICSTGKLPTGKVKIVVETKLIAPKPGAPAAITLTVNGKSEAQGTVPMTVPLLFTANDCLDIGTDLGSPVSLAYYDKAPFAFNGTIQNVYVQYIK